MNRGNAETRNVGNSPLGSIKLCHIFVYGGIILATFLSVPGLLKVFG